MFSHELRRDAGSLLDDLQARGIRLATVESCTGGLLAALLTEIPGASAVVERGFVTYSNDAKIEMVGVSAGLVAANGAVSREVALAMAEGALNYCNADIAVAVTGVAGPGGGTSVKPVGLVHIAAARQGARSIHEVCRFGDIGRGPIRLAAVRRALAIVGQLARAPNAAAGKT